MVGKFRSAPPARVGRHSRVHSRANDALRVPFEARAKHWCRSSIPRFRFEIEQEDFARVELPDVAGDGTPPPGRAAILRPASNLIEGQGCPAKLSACAGRRDLAPCPGALIADARGTHSTSSWTRSTIYPDHARRAFRRAVVALQ